MALSAHPNLSLAFFLLVALATPACEGGRAARVQLDEENRTGLYWEPGDELSPAVLVVPEAPGQLEECVALGSRLQGSGYAVLAIEVGAQEAAGAAASEEDLQANLAAGFAFLRHQKRVDAARLAAIGVGTGAEAALRFSAGEPSIRALVLLSPPVRDGASPVEAAMGDYSWRPVLLAAGRAEPYGSRVEELARRAHATAVVELYESEAQGFRLLRETESLTRAILDFLDEQLRSGGPS